MSRLGGIGARLYSGDVSIDFVGRRRTWYLLSLAILAVAVAALVLRGLTFGIEFRGGVEFQARMAPTEANVVATRDAVVGTGLDAASDPVVTTSGDDAIRIQTEPLTSDEINQVVSALTQAGAGEVSQQAVGPTWGQQIANKALIGLLVFLVLVVLFIWAYFREWRMSLAALVALAHDVVITIGIYALAGFEVTPATVTGVLTILGYSLYDTVVVFDKVRENTRGITASNRRTYAEAANLAVNQTLVRSINTSVVALLPVGAILWVGAVQLGTGPLKDLALALFVGMAAGTYSSIFIATPLLVQLKEREPAVQAQARRVGARRRKDAEAAAIRGPAREAPAADGTAAEAPAPPGGTARPAASGSTVATTTRPPREVRPTGGSGANRAQPSRQARAKRRAKGSR